MPNTTLAVAAPCAAEYQKNCDAPVWWPERRAQNPIPSRTRPLNTPAPMVLCLKTRESRSPPDPPIASTIPSTRHRSGPGRQRHRPSRQAPRTRRNTLGAGWSSPVARQAHNLKVTGSNPVPATKHTNPPRPKARRVCVFGCPLCAEGSELPRLQVGRRDVQNPQDLSRRIAPITREGSLELLSPARDSGWKCILSAQSTGNRGLESSIARAAASLRL